MIKDLSYSIAVKSVLIIDEFDEVVDEYAAVFGAKKKGVRVRGLGPAYHSLKAYILSATVEVFHSKLMKNVFKIPDKTIRTYRSVAEINKTPGLGEGS